MWLSPEWGIRQKIQFNTRMRAHARRGVYTSLRHDGFNGPSLALESQSYFFTQASSPTFNPTYFHLDRVVLSNSSGNNKTNNVYLS